MEIEVIAINGYQVVVAMEWLGLDTADASRHKLK